MAFISFSWFGQSRTIAGIIVNSLRVGKQPLVAMPVPIPARGTSSDAAWTKSLPPSLEAESVFWPLPKSQLHAIL